MTAAARGKIVLFKMPGMKYNSTDKDKIHGGIAL